MIAAVSAGHALVTMLGSLGVTHFYGPPRGRRCEVLDAVERDPGLTSVSPRSDAAASFMAEAQGRLKGVPAVVVATRASAGSGLWAGVRLAYQDGTPLIILVGREDLPVLCRPMVKWATSLEDPDDAADVAYRAFAAATTGRPGPVLVELPAGVLGRETVGRLGADHPAVGTCGTLGAAAPGIAADLRDRLVSARRPVAIVGSGVVDARTELSCLARKFGVGVFTAPGRQDVFPNDHPNYLGQLAPGASARAAKPLEDADLVLLLGSRIGDVGTPGRGLIGPGAVMLAIGDDPCGAAAGPAPDLAFTADVAPVLREVLSAAGDAMARDAMARDAMARDEVVRDEVEIHHRAYLDDSEPQYLATASGVHPVSVIRAMRDALPGDSVIACDAGAHSAYLRRYWRYRFPRTQLAPEDGTTGYAVPAAVAAKLNRPERTVVAVVGDDDFPEAGAEIETSVRLGAPVIVVVMCESPHGAAAPRPAEYGRTLGAEGVRVADHRELMVALDSAFCSLHTTVIEVPVAPDVIVPGQWRPELPAQYGEFR